MGRSRKTLSKRHFRYKNSAPITMKRVSEIQSRQAKLHGGMIPKGSKAAKLMSYKAKQVLANQRKECRIRSGCRCCKDPMGPDAAARIMSVVAKCNGGMVPKGSFAARAQRASAKNCALKK